MTTIVTRAGKGSALTHDEVDANFTGLDATDGVIAASVTTEAGARAAADSTLSSAISAEASSRASADSTLTAAITSEAGSRASADTSEASARATADGLLLAKSDNLASVATPATAWTNLGGGTAGKLASDTDGTLAADSDANVPTQKAVKTYVDAAVVGGGTGNVVGPASAVDGKVVLFDGTTGKLIKDSGLSLSGSNTGDQTNISGNAATVTTNANLTGPITSSGNATSIASQTGSGTKFVMDTAPTIAGGLISALTSFGVRSTGAAFDLKIASAEVLTATRTLTFSLGDAARTLTLSGNPTLSGFTATGTGTLALGTKTLNVSNSLTLAGTDSTTMTFPSTSATIARTDAGQTFTGGNTFSSAVTFSALTAGRIPYSSTAGLQTDSTNLAWDNGTASLNIGTPTPDATAPISVLGSNNGGLRTLIKNSSNGSAAQVGIFAYNDAANQYVALLKYSTGFTTSGLVVADAANLHVRTGKFILDTVDGSDHIFVVGPATTAANEVLRLSSTTGVTIKDAVNVTTGTTTGTKFGASTSQKLAFWNATPIVQPTTAIAASTFAANTAGTLNDSATWDGYTMGQVVKALRNEGLLA